MGCAPVVLAMALSGCAHDGPDAAATSPSGAARAAVLATVDGMFAAMARKDAGGVRAACLPDATIVRVGSSRGGPGSDGQTGGPVRATTVSVAAFADGLTELSADLEERWTSPPQVRVSGDLADVWGRYELRVDGARHHCGVDAIHLVRLEGGWRIAAITYSETPDACPAR